MTLADAEIRPSRAHVAMVVTDGAASRGRARSWALALVEAGFEVTLLTAGEDAAGVQDWPGVVKVIRLDVPFTLRNERRARLARRRKWVPPVGYRDALADRAARARLQAARLAVSSSGRPAVTSAVLTFREQTLSARVLVHRAIRKALRITWRGLDVTVGRLPAGASWRRSLPETDDYEAVFGPALDRVGADALSVHEVELVGVVARASARARLAGQRVPWVYDAEVDLARDEPGLVSSPRKRAATLSLEKDFLRYAGRVVASSEPLADTLARRCRLRRRPAVITTRDEARIADLFAELLGAEAAS